MALYEHFGNNELIFGLHTEKISLAESQELAIIDCFHRKITLEMRLPLRILGISGAEKIMGIVLFIVTTMGHKIPQSIVMHNTVRGSFFLIFL
jgi:hypothetical protein